MCNYFYVYCLYFYVYTLLLIKHFYGFWIGKTWGTIFPIFCTSSEILINWNYNYLFFNLPHIIILYCLSTIGKLLRSEECGVVLHFTQNSTGWCFHCHILLMVFLMIVIQYLKSKYADTTFFHVFWTWNKIIELCYTYNVKFVFNITITSTNALDKLKIFIIS